MNVLFTPYGRSHVNILLAAMGHNDTSVTIHDEFDCVIGNSFGTSTGAHSVNHDILEHCYAGSTSGWGCPLIVDQTLADVDYEGYGPLVIDHVVKGPVSTTTGKGTGTWGVLQDAAIYMKWQMNVGTKTPLRPLIIGQAFHAGRIAMQARKLGMEPLVGSNLPRRFDRQSAQPWTRSLALWVPREVIGSTVLKRKGQL